MERTLSMIKPNGLKNADKIFDLIGSLDAIAVSTKTIRFTKDQAYDFYKEHERRDTFPQLIEFMSSGDCIAIVLEGPSIIKKHRELMKVIRNRFSEGLIENTIHGSDSVASAEREINFVYDLNCLNTSEVVP